MPKRLLRSVLDVNGNPSLENLRVNFKRLSDSGIEWRDPSDRVIYKFILGYFQHHLDCPSLQVVQDYFQEKDEIEAIERLKDIAAAEAYERTAFAHLLNGRLSEQNNIKAQALLREAQDIITKGMSFGEGRKAVRKEGIQDAIAHLGEGLNPLVLEDSATKTRGDLRADTRAGWEEYIYAEANRDKAYGKLTGIDKIDHICHGHKKGEMWLHAAFTGELKSTFALNWGYNLITRYRANVFYVSLEMPYPQIRRQLHTLHTANKRFEVQGLAPLDYRKVRDGELTASEKDFYNTALRDLETNPEYCSFETWCPDRDLTMADIKREAEVYHRRKEIGLIVIDHGGLVEPQKKFNDHNIALNSVLRDSKKLALQFNRGEGIPVLTLFQLNRQGKNEADKNDGEYKMNAISHANEAERSADVITTTYLNKDLKTRGLTKFGNLKNRDNPLFDSFEANVNFSCRHIYNAEMHEIEGMSIDQNDLDAIGSV